MRALTRRGRLTVTLCVVATVVTWILTFHWASRLDVFLVVLGAEALAILFARLLDARPWRRASESLN